MSTKFYGIDIKAANKINEDINLIKAANPEITKELADLIEDYKAIQIANLPKEYLGFRFAHIGMAAFEATVSKEELCNYLIFDDSGTIYPKEEIEAIYIQ